MEIHPFCEYCGKEDQLTLDHIIPITRGSENCISNITVACHSCNASKNNKLLSEWKGVI